jgi:thiamine biosynthesis protein ThiS
MPASKCITLNGDPLNTSSSSLAGLIVELKLDKRLIAVERNLEVVPKSAYEKTLLVDGDRIEIVHMIGGG